MTETMDGYIRISRRLGRKGAAYISPTVQREAIERWAEYRGVTILAWHTDEDESGGTHSRPGLDAARDRALNGETGGIVSWKIDRFSRFTEGGLRDLRLLEGRGARLAFVTEDIDTSGPMGKLVYTMLLAFAEFFLDNIKAGWVVTKTRAVERGAHIGPTPFGYQRRDDSILEADDVLGPVVTEAFEVCERAGLHAAVEFLAEHAPGRTWTAFTVRRLLTSRVYLGRVAYGELVHDSAHPALVSEEQFRATGRILAKTAGHRRAAKSDYPLSELAACASCGGHLVGGRGGNDNRRIYRCAARCPGRVTISAHIVEGVVVTAVRRRLADVEGRASAERNVHDAQVTLDRAQSDLDAAIRAFAGLEDEDAARTRLAELRDARDEARTRVEHLGSPRLVMTVNLGREWNLLTLEERRLAIRLTVAAVRVAPGRGAGRVSVELLGDQAAGD
jgi:DNA invertase Pin-like site-specific DNA recombinase